MFSRNPFSSKWVAIACGPGHVGWQNDTARLEIGRRNYGDKENASHLRDNVDVLAAEQKKLLTVVWLLLWLLDILAAVENRGIWWDNGASSALCPVISPVISANASVCGCHTWQWLHAQNQLLCVEKSRWTWKSITWVRGDRDQTCGRQWRTDCYCGFPCAAHLSESWIAEKEEIQKGFLSFLCCIAFRRCF